MKIEHAYLTRVFLADTTSRAYWGSGACGSIGIRDFRERRQGGGEDVDEAQFIFSRPSRFLKKRIDKLVRVVQSWGHAPVLQHSWPLQSA